jgi:uncharacterized protein YciI
MFIILLKFSKNREHASKFMDAHMKWLKQGFDDEVFILAGGIKPHSGGAIIAKNSSIELIKSRVTQDPFVIQNIVEFEILEINPSKMVEGFTELLKE